MMEQDLIANTLAGFGLRSAPFIVTVYGDVVVPRGGVLWTGTLIETCAHVGINESLVRTALSRLVAARQLRGERIGRRSYYRLDRSAQQEFDQAARLLYAPDLPARGWQILHAPDLSERDAAHLRLGQMGGRVYIRPDRGQPAPDGALLLRAADPDDLATLGRFWDLSGLDRRYRDMLDRFTPVEQATRGGNLGDEAALVLRLLLVHAYRAALLRDPRLPEAALPPDWHGAAARDLFRLLYLRLSPPAARHIGARFEGPEGMLAEHSPLTAQRLAGLAG